MSNFEKVLIGIAVLSVPCLKLLLAFELTSGELFFAISQGSIFALDLYYLIKSKNTLFKFLFLAVIIQTTANFFIIQHWPGAGPMQLIGAIGLAVFALFLLKPLLDGIRVDIFIVALGLIVLFYATSELYIPYEYLNRIDLLVSYALVAIIGTIKLQQTKVEPHVGKYLNVLLIQGIWLVSSNLLLLIFD